ncbi:glycosyltransferase family 4 protein [Rhodobacteraceae bacterium DSL-40]|uniref:glycosyltransferase family 4 protein n=1 Tax=Amaricoccus sp. B4 TaxID=3368557 RepID=UPI000DAB91D8
MSKFRILEIAHDHPAWTTGGTEHVAQDLARGLDARDGVAARLLVAATSLQRPGAAPGSLQAIGEDFVLCTGRYDRFSMLREDGTDWLEGLGQVLEITRPDLVHLHGLDRLGAEILPAIRRMRPRARIVLTLHDYQLICPGDGLLLTRPEGMRCPGMDADRCRNCFPEIEQARHALRRAHLQALLDCVDLFIAPSTFLKDRFVDWGLAESRIRVVPNAVVQAGISWDSPAPRARRDRFAYFGNILPHKGVLVLLEAAARLRETDSTLRVNFHGGLGWAEQDFRSAFKAGLTAAGQIAQHLGPYDRGDLPNLLARTDWVVMPSLWWENAPLVILEARAAGIPVICSGVGGMAELVRDGIDGLHVPPGDAAALAETMVRAATEPGLWERLAAAPVAPVSHEAFVSTHLDLFNALFNRVAA